MIEIDEQWIKRRDRAVKTILRCKQKDGLKGGKTVQTLEREMRELDEAYYQKLNRIIAETQSLNADPKQIPMELRSFPDVVDAFSLILDGSKLTEITHRWLEASGQTVVAGYDYYYNETFLCTVLRYNEQAIAVGNLDAIKFMLDAWNRPIVYLHDADSPVRDEKRWSELLDNWRQIDADHKQQSDETSTLELLASRGDFWVNREYPWGRLFWADQKEIYQIESLMFFDFLNAMYRLSEEHPDCFGKGAQAILDGLYTHYKEFLFGNREIDQSEFERKFTQQFLYMTDDRIELCIDLYRHVDESKENGTDFIGGLFHVFDHFQGFNFSVKNPSSIQLHEDFLLDMIRDMLFNYLPAKKKVHKTGETYCIHQQYDTPMRFEDGVWTYSLKDWRGTFHYSFDKQCFSLTTIHSE